MKKLTTLFLFMSALVMANAADFTATQAGSWDDAATWGGTGVPGATDNVNTAGFEVTIAADVACANLTYANSSAQLAIGDGITLTVNGLVNSSTALVSGSNPFSTMHANGIVKLTGASLGESDVNLIMDQAINATTSNSTGIKINNLIIAGADPNKTYKFGQSNRNYIHGTGYFKIMGGTKIDLENIMQLGSAETNGLIVESGAEVLAKQNLKGSGGNATKITSITINGKLTCNNGLNTVTLNIGDNGYFKTSKNKGTNDDATLAGWWSAINSPGTTLTNYGIPTTITMGTNSTVEFAGGSTQSVQGKIPGTETSIPYANVIISGTATKDVKSALNATGTVLNFGTLTGEIVSCPNIINVTSADITNGTVSGTVNGSTVSLVGTALAGYHFVNWTEGENEVSNASEYNFTASGNKTLVANFSLSTDLTSEKANSYVAVNDRNLQFNEEVISVDIFNAQGKPIAVQNKNIKKININSNGVYIVRMLTSKGIEIQKLLIK